MIIDFHTHVYPEKIAEKGVEYIRSFYQLSSHEKGTVAHLKHVSAEAGVGHAVVLGVAVRPDLVEAVNSFTASILDDFIIGFGSSHAASENKIAILEKSLEYGFKGMKIHPDMQGFSIDDSRMDPVYAWLSEHDIPICIHMGDARYETSRPKRLANVLDAFPKLTVIAAHFGGYQRWDEALAYLVGRPNVWMDTSSTVAYIEDIDKARHILDVHGYEHFLFGTDYPLTTPKEELKRLELLHLNEQERDAILYENAKRLLKL